MSSCRECCPKSVSASCRGMLLKVYMSCRGMLPKVGAVLQGNVAKSIHVVLQGNVAQSGCRPAGECCPKWVLSCRGMLSKVGVVLQGNVATDRLLLSQPEARSGLQTCTLCASAPTTSVLHISCAKRDATELSTALHRSGV